MKRQLWGICDWSGLFPYNSLPNNLFYKTVFYIAFLIGGTYIQPSR